VAIPKNYTQKTFVKGKQKMIKGLKKDKHVASALLSIAESCKVIIAGDELSAKTIHGLSLENKDTVFMTIVKSAIAPADVEYIEDVLRMDILPDIINDACIHVMSMVRPLVCKEHNDEIINMILNVDEDTIDMVSSVIPKTSEILVMLSSTSLTSHMKTRLIDYLCCTVVYLTNGNRHLEVTLLLIPLNNMGLTIREVYIRGLIVNSLLTTKDTEGLSFTDMYDHLKPLMGKRDRRIVSPCTHFPKLDIVIQSPTFHGKRFELSCNNLAIDHTATDQMEFLYTDQYGKLYSQEDALIVAIRAKQVNVPVDVTVLTTDDLYAGHLEVLPTKKY